jgi:hypothetical protein
MKRETIATNPNQARAFIASFNTYPCKITITDDTKKRSLPANAVQHCFYKTISEYTGEDIKTSGNRMKRDIGLPILLSGEYGEKVAWMLQVMNFYCRPDAKQISMMDLIPVTSLFTSKEHTSYRDNMLCFWNDNGLILEYKE